MSDEREKIDQLSGQVAQLSFALGIALGALDLIQISGHSSAARDALETIWPIVNPIYSPSITIPVPKPPKGTQCPNSI